MPHCPSQKKELRRGVRRGVGWGSLKSNGSQSLAVIELLSCGTTFWSQSGRRTHSLSLADVVKGGGGLGRELRLPLDLLSCNGLRASSSSSSSSSSRPLMRDSDRTSRLELLSSGSHGFSRGCSDGRCPSESEAVTTSRAKKKKKEGVTMSLSTASHTGERPSTLKWHAVRYISGNFFFVVVFCSQAL